MEIDVCQFCGQTAYVKPIYLDDEMHLICYECFEKNILTKECGTVLMQNHKIYFAENNSVKFKLVHAI